MPTTDRMLKAVIHANLVLLKVPSVNEKVYSNYVALVESSKVISKANNLTL